MCFRYEFHGSVTAFLQLSLRHVAIRAFGDCSLPRPPEFEGPPRFPLVFEVGKELALPEVLRRLFCPLG